ncbi:MAG: ribonuclease III [Thiobacillaceae bacterium]|nr:ribonuclease III [Thiobacillaceae bacterium]
MIERPILTLTRHAEPQHDALEQRLDYRFRRARLLEQALTHRSYSAQHNERLEFLGDGVLNCAIGHLLYERFPQLTEGRLSRLRANLVNQQSLYEVAQALTLGEHLRLGEGEARSGGRERPSILADAVEAIIGAVFLDGGYDAAQALVQRLFAAKLGAIDPSAHSKDAKTRLQEWLQARRRGLPVYALVHTSGQAHAQTFEVECRIEAMSLVTRGCGASRKAAEQAAAEAALARLTEVAEG